MATPRTITTELSCPVISMGLIINITKATKNALQIIKDILMKSHISVFEGIITIAKQKRLVMTVNKMYLLVVTLTYTHLSTGVSISFLKT
jgi:hypothetical protein